MPVRPPVGNPREGAWVVAAAVVAAAVLAVSAAGALFASACSTTFEQPTDAGPFVMYEGGHPPPSMYGSPCDLDVDPREHCCGPVAKEVPGTECYGCLGKVAYALCVEGAFACACTCEPPIGYSLLPTDGAGSDCGTAALEGGEDAPPSDASSDTQPTDAPPIADGPDAG